MSFRFSHLHLPSLMIPRIRGNRRGWQGVDKDMQHLAFTWLLPDHTDREILVLLHTTLLICWVANSIHNSHVASHSKKKRCLLLLSIVLLRVITIVAAQYTCLSWCMADRVSSLYMEFSWNRLGLQAMCVVELKCLLSRIYPPACKARHIRIPLMHASVCSIRI